MSDQNKLPIIVGRPTQEAQERLRARYAAWLGRTYGGRWVVTPRATTAAPTSASTRKAQGLPYAT